MATTIDAHAERRLLCPDPWRVALMLLKHGTRGQSFGGFPCRWFGGWVATKKPYHITVSKREWANQTSYDFRIRNNSQLGRAILAAWDEVKA